MNFLQTLYDKRLKVAQTLAGHREYIATTRDNYLLVRYQNAGDTLGYEITLILIDGNVWQYKYYNPKHRHGYKYLSPKVFAEKVCDEVGL